MWIQWFSLEMVAPFPPLDASRGGSAYLMTRTMWVLSLVMARMK